MYIIRMVIQIIRKMIKMECISVAAIYYSF